MENYEVWLQRTLEMKTKEMMIKYLEENQQEKPKTLIDELAKISSLSSKDSLAYLYESYFQKYDDKQRVGHEVVENYVSLCETVYRNHILIDENKKLRQFIEQQCSMPFDDLIFVLSFTIEKIQDLLRDLGLKTVIHGLQGGNVIIYNSILNKFTAKQKLKFNTALNEYYCSDGSIIQNAKICIIEWNNKYEERLRTYEEFYQRSKDLNDPRYELCLMISSLLTPKTDPVRVRFWERKFIKDHIYQAFTIERLDEIKRLCLEEGRKRIRVGR